MRRVIFAWLVFCTALSALLAIPFSLDSRGFRALDGTQMEPGWALYWYLFLGGMIIFTVISVLIFFGIWLFEWATRTR